MKFTLKDYVIARARWAAAGLVLALLGGLGVFLLAIVISQCEIATLGKFIFGLWVVVMLFVKLASSDSR